MQFSIPFFESPDDYHCVQACLKMILKFWLPEQDFDFEELDAMTGQDGSSWTWQGTYMLKLQKQGFKIVNIENLDYKKFASEGPPYLKSIWDEETYEAQNQYGDLKEEQRIAEKLINTDGIEMIERDLISVDDIRFLLEKDYTVLASINPYVLRDESGYSSHLVVVVGIDSDSIEFHDPGPPGVPNRKEPIDLFIRAMNPPQKPDINLIAIKKG